MTAPTAGGMSVGSVGGGAVVLQGQNLTNLNLRFDLADVGDVAQAQALIDDVRAKLGVRAAFGTTMRRLEPAVLVNRKAELDKLSELLNSGVPIVVVTGVAGVGKSSLARAALELRPADVPVIWFAAESTRVGDIATRIDAVCGLGLDLGPDPARSTGAVLARLQQPLILVVDGVEALLDDDFALLDPEYAAFLETIAETEHPARLILTGRASPLELDGHPQARVLALKGISAIAAETLLVTSSTSKAGTAEFLRLGLIDRLNGNPKLITLLGASLDNLPPALIAANLPEASDIGRYLTREVISRLADDERELVVTAALMPATFSVDDLLALHEARQQPATAFGPLKALFRRNLVERTEDGRCFMHALISSSALVGLPGAGRASVEAADWFTARAVERDDLELLVWAAGLLLSALGREPDEDVLTASTSFIDAQARELSFAGYGRLVIALVRTVRDLVEDEAWRFSLSFLLANELWQLNDYAAADIELSALWAELQTGEDEVTARTACLVGAKLGETKLALSQVDAAAELAELLEPLALADGELQTAVRIQELRFGIARNREDAPGMLAAARTRFEFAHAWNTERGGTQQTLDALAEAHFALAVSYLRVDDAASHVVRNFVQQLKIKLDIGKVGGVQSGLFNLGHLLVPVEPGLGGLMLGTARHLAARIGDESTDDLADHAEEFAALVDDPEAAARAIEELGELDPRLIPYAREAVDRAAAAARAAAANAGGSVSPASP